MKHYDVHLINAEDGYDYAGLKRYSKENLKTHIVVHYIWQLVVEILISFTH